MRVCLNRGGRRGSRRAAAVLRDPLPPPRFICRTPNPAYEQPFASAERQSNCARALDSRDPGALEHHGRNRCPCPSRQVRRRCRRRDTRAASKFPGGKRLATQQRAEHRGSGRVADHAGNASELAVRSGSCTHASYGNRQTVRYSPNYRPCTFAIAACHMPIVIDVTCRAESIAPVDTRGTPGHRPVVWTATIHGQSPSDLPPNPRAATLAGR